MRSDMQHARFTLLLLLLLAAACSADSDATAPDGDEGVTAPDVSAPDTPTPAADTTDEGQAPGDDGRVDAADGEPEEDAPPSDAGDAGDAGDAPEPIHIESAGGCEDLNPLYCPLPWPSDRYLVPDPDSDTGVRLGYEPELIPGDGGSRPGALDFFARLDGFSPSSQILFVAERHLDLSGAPGLDTLERSLDPDCPTVLFDLDAGERLPHWVEHDARWKDSEAVVLYVRPTRRLEPNHRYAVALRGLSYAEGGSPLSPSPAFEALRDALPTDSEILESRRPSYETLFAALEAAGVERAGLQAAWWWHTASFDSTHEHMIRMRDDAVERLGPSGLGCEVTEVDDNFRKLARRVRGTVTVPSYIDRPGQGAALVRDGEGRPVYNGEIEVPFSLIFPHSVREGSETVPLVTWGHGLFGEGDGFISNKDAVRVASSEKNITLATDWAGMSSNDLGFLAVALSDVTEFYKVGEHLMQAMINKIAMTRSFAGVCRDLPEILLDGGTPAVDPERLYYVGGSQGSILGAALMALSPDITRGALIVGGESFSFMIERSIHYRRFEPLLMPTFPSRLDRAFLMAVSQHVWDRAETAAWLGPALQDLPGLPKKEIFYLVAKNDAQVPNLSSELAVRSAGLPVLEGSVLVPWATETVESPYTGSAFIAFDLGDRDPPPGNVSPEEDDGGHGAAGLTDWGVQMTREFFATGVLTVPCGGACVKGQ